MFLQVDDDLLGTYLTYLLTICKYRLYGCKTQPYRAMDSSPLVSPYSCLCPYIFFLFIVTIDKVNVSMQFSLRYKV